MIATTEKTAAEIAKDCRHDAARLYSAANVLIELAETLEPPRVSDSPGSARPTGTRAGGTR